jgi:DNA-binding PadR family transcriptional regulator
MSSIRLFVLSSFDALGPMHGHRLRLEAERKHVHLWTDIPVGAVYGAMKRLAAEGLLREIAEEREGNRPIRQIYDITDRGRTTLAELRRTGLSDVWFKFDPFDLALTRMDADQREDLPTTLADRLTKVRMQLDEVRSIYVQAHDFVGLAERWALRHSQYRLEAELRYLGDLLEAAADIVADECHPAPRKPKKAASSNGN